MFTVLEFMEYIVRMFHENVVNFRAKKVKYEHHSSEFILESYIGCMISSTFFDLNLIFALELIVDRTLHSITLTEEGKAKKRV